MELSKRYSFDCEKKVHLIAFVYPSVHIATQVVFLNTIRTIYRRQNTSPVFHSFIKFFLCLFFSVFIYIVTYEKNLNLILSILIFQFSVFYLEPYNTALNVPQVNVLTIISVLFFIVFLIQFSSKKQKENKFTKYN